MSIWERLQGPLVGAAALAGLVLGLAVPVAPLAGQLVLPALLVMLAAMFVQVDAGQLREAGRARTVVATSLLLNFVWTPLLAWALGAGLLGDSPDLRLGLLLLLVTPCTDWYLVFTGLARGHLGVAAALLPINLVLQLLLLPVYVLLLGGAAIGEAAFIDAGTVVRAVLLVLLVPLLAAMVLRWATRAAFGTLWRDRTLVPFAERAVPPLLYLAVLAMFAWQAETVVEHGLTVAALLAPLAVFFAITPVVSTVLGRALRIPEPHRVTLTMTTVARNSPIALALAVAAFPDRPLIAVSLVIAPLIELPVLAVISQLLRIPADRAP
ncbi:arsenic resistance protein [Haloechinothrix sp. LS1_15]|uniref:arsenic resistance protein n=1 Tax=Haloechinothrix sp. LS1_15 TaxID=2652248 RepID=UPI002948094C|nr:arsenic resistance protein [Haloechinothrix sp. LS1_15]MDV6014124.1 arsenic resistance protein [Haloechinothrix sp. LS1_15]